MQKTVGQVLRKKLTKRLIDQTPLLDPNDKKTRNQKIIWDDTLRGFGVRVGVNNKVFIAQRDVAGRTVRVSIGKYGVFTVDQARKEAQQLLAKMSLGTNPNEVKRNLKSKSITLGAALELYIESSRSKGRSESTIKVNTYAINRYLKDWLKRPLASFTRHEVRTRHINIAKWIKNGKYEKKHPNSKAIRSKKKVGEASANTAMGGFRTIYNRAMRQHEDLPVNPCINIDWFAKKRRQAAIPKDDLSKWYREVMAISNPVRRDLLLFMLFSGLRSGDARSLRVDQVDFEQRKIFIPMPKSKRPFDLPMSDYIYNLLKKRIVENKEDMGATEYVFPSDRIDGHIKEPRVKLNVNYTPHGLRHTFITVAESIDVSPYAIKLIVNHAIPNHDVTGGYVTATLERLRDPMQNITDKLLDICTKESDDKPAPDTGNVVKLRVVSSRG